MMAVTSRSQDWFLIWRFGVVGMVNTALSYVVFAILVLLSGWPGASLAGATIAGVAFNFQTSRRLIFRSNGRALWFVAVYIVVFALNWAALRGLLWYGVPPLWAQALLTLPIAAVSFIGQRTLVFGQTLEPTRP
jgi:putative flippase GtrA